MARTNLHELATKLLNHLQEASHNNIFEGKLRQVAAEAGLNSVRSAEAVKLLEDIGRIEVEQRGRRGRNTVIVIRSTEGVELQDAEAALPSRGGKRTSRLNYDDLGKSVVDRLLELARDDALRSAQVEAFAAESTQMRDRIETLESRLEDARHRETDVRIKLRAAEEALVRAEENLERAFGPQRPEGQSVRMEDDEAKAVLDILRSGRI